MAPAAHQRRFRTRLLKWVGPLLLLAIVLGTNIWTSGWLRQPLGVENDLSDEPLPLFVLTSFSDGRTFGEGVRVLSSKDGASWQALAGDPIVLPQGMAGTVVRDPSVMWHNGFFHLAFTTELCAGLQTLSFSCPWRQQSSNPPPARFAYARSRDLVHWEDVRPVPVPLPGACNIWAPEWHTLSPTESAAVGGHAFMIIFSATVPASSRQVRVCVPLGRFTGGSLL